MNGNTDHKGKTSSAASLASDDTKHQQRHSWPWVAAALVVVAASTVGGVALWAPAPPQHEASVKLSTEPVTLGSMLSETTVQGKIQYADKTPITAGFGGTVTELPSPGATISAGGVLYRVNTIPVILLSGTQPAWRDFSLGMDDGADVLQLESNLKAFGFFTREPDRSFTWSTAAGIRDWQKASGLDRTGTVEKSQIVFSGQDLKVNTVESHVGAEVSGGTALLQASGSNQIVELTVKSSDRSLAVPGATVTVMLPTGDPVEGTVATVGLPVEITKSDGSGSTVGIPVVVTIADQAAIDEFSLSSVSVKFSSVLRNDVLTVPIDALVPVDDTTFAVELPKKTAEGKRTLLPVKVGGFSAGNVEISGKGIIDGLDVVVPRR